MQGLRSRGLRGSPFRFKGLSYGATGGLSLTLGPLLAGWAWAYTIAGLFWPAGKPREHGQHGRTTARGSHAVWPEVWTLGGARRWSPVVLL